MAVRPIGSCKFSSALSYFSLFVAAAMLARLYNHFSLQLTTNQPRKKKEHTKKQNWEYSQQTAAAFMSIRNNGRRSQSEMNGRKSRRNWKFGIFPFAASTLTPFTHSSFLSVMRLHSLVNCTIQQFQCCVSLSTTVRHPKKQQQQQQQQCATGKRSKTPSLLYAAIDFRWLPRAILVWLLILSLFGFFGKIILSKNKKQKMCTICRKIRDVLLLLA